MKFFPLTVLLGLGAAGIGGWYKFIHLKPKTLRQYLEWQGFKLIKDTERNHWLSVLHENKKVAEDLNISNIDEIKWWCEVHLDSENYEDFKVSASLLCIDNPKTVKARIIQLDGNIDGLIKDGEMDEYKVSYIFKKHIAGVTETIGFLPPEQEKGQPIKEDLENAGRALSTWCKKSLDAAPNDTIVANVKLLCFSKGFGDIFGLIKLRGEESLLLTNPNNLGDLNLKYNSIKGLSSWENDPTKSGSSFMSLYAWCDETQKKKFSEEGTFSNIYPKFRFRCLKTTRFESQAVRAA
ncbi:hypothetical protein MHC_04205 [Mycoplasma haemocanis str. Illinois]|uniref:Uncharacterized protein n=1 Tax=Mycoplasma haemocanis (strain Illinois) TaxID=1111676 RepID=H6N7S5_MYCHN|nr:hypothetical protein [Mycoplasma haemocanis]AEW45697.1 hypothetical protein MHC_04205 [Mycoplasma haemocanis str. Illinois]